MWWTCLSSIALPYSNHLTSIDFPSLRFFIWCSIWNELWYFGVISKIKIWKFAITWWVTIQYCLATRVDNFKGKMFRSGFFSGIRVIKDHWMNRQQNFNIKNRDYLEGFLDSDYKFWFYDDPPLRVKNFVI